MKRIKSTFVVLLAAVMVASMSACGGSSSSSSAPDASAPSSSAASDAPSEASSSAPESESEAPSEADAPAGDPLSEEDYANEMKAAFQAMQDAVTEVQGLDPTTMDVAALEAAIKPVTDSLHQLGDLNAPEKYAEGQAKYKEGTDKMAEYFDYMIEIAGMADADFTAEKQQEVIAKMTEYLTQATTAINEGQTLLANAGLDFSSIVAQPQDGASSAAEGESSSEEITPVDETSSAA